MKDTHQRWLIGIDEVGRGPLAGPVAVGAFAVPYTWDMRLLGGIRDSKTLSENQRSAWYTRLKATPGARYVVSTTGPTSIDTHGIVWSIRHALTRALAKLSLDPRLCEVFLDGGLYAPSCYEQQTTIIKGDSLNPLISAAAICAKVHRDTEMVELARKYPQYGFERHKGYGTRFHRDMVLRHGLTPVHRKSFCRNIDIDRAVYNRAL